jgi:hypothetical protein
VADLNGAGPATAETVNEAQKVVVAGKPSSRSLSKPQGQLADLAQRIRTEHVAVTQATNAVLNHALAAGRALIEAQKLVPPRQWGEWLSCHCEVSDRHARRYMALVHAYDNRGHSVSEDFVGLSLRGLMQRLTPPQKRMQPNEHSVSESKPKQEPKRVTHRDLLALWLDLPVEGRKPFFDAIGLRSVLESVPENWKQVEAGIPTRMAVEDAIEQAIVDLPAPATTSRKSREDRNFEKLAEKWLTCAVLALPQLQLLQQFQAEFSMLILSGEEAKIAKVIGGLDIRTAIKIAGAAEEQGIKLRQIKLREAAKAGAS